MSLVEMFCLVDGFCGEFEPQWERFLIAHNLRQRRRRARLLLSEVMTVIIHFLQLGYRNFKTYCLLHVQLHLRREFSNLVSTAASCA